MSHDLILMSILDDLLYLKFDIHNGSKNQSLIDGFENIVGGIGLSSLNKHNTKASKNCKNNNLISQNTNTNINTNTSTSKIKNNTNNKDKRLNNCILLRATENELPNCLKNSYVVVCCDKNKWYKTNDKYKISISINGSKYHHFYNYDNRILNINNIPKFVNIPNQKKSNITTNQPMCVFACCICQFLLFECLTVLNICL